VVLAGSALLLFRRSVAWTWFGLILATEVGILAAIHADPGTITMQVIDGSVVIALATYALTRLTDVISDLRATRTAMARATAREARLRAARDVFGVFGAQLSSLAGSAEQARRQGGFTLVAEVPLAPQPAGAPNGIGAF
jgi:two-component system sensor histidine kinase DesK